MDVAVKVPNRQTLNEQQLQNLRTELEIMSNLLHPCIVLFMGACTVEGSFRIVTELLEGDLSDLIHKKKAKLSLFEKMKMAKDAALGMNWLHNSKPQIIHRDLKLGNLLIYRQGNEYRVKICDFGLSSIKGSPEEMLRDLKGARGTPMYMAPEVMRNKEFDEKADIYSFGIVLWEILTEQKPFESHRDWNTFVVAVADDRERPIIPASCLPSLRSLIEDCWAHRPNERPSFAEITERLSGIIVEAAIADPLGCQLWKENFLDNYNPAWPTFATKLYEFLNVPLPNDPENPIVVAKPVTGEQWIPPHKRAAAAAAAAAASQSSAPSTPAAPTDPAEPKPLPSPEVAAFRCIKALLALHAMLTSFTDKDGTVGIVRFSEVLEWFTPLTRNEDFLDRVRSLLGMPWFHGLLSNTDLPRILNAAPENTYLVRFSTSSPGAYSISRVVKGGTTSHIRINRKKDEKGQAKYFISDERDYDSIIELIDDVSAPLGLTHPAKGSPFLPLFGGEAPKGGGYEVVTRLDKSGS